MEIAATLMVVLGVAVALGGPFLYERARRVEAAGQVDQEIRLTGVARTGTWTDRDVNAVNYATAEFPPARPVIREGQEVRLVLSSADVTHSFYCPELGVGPVHVIPGHVEEVRFRAAAAGTYRYYCTAVCGPCHYYMQGDIVVLAPDAPIPTVDGAGEKSPTVCDHSPPGEASAGFLSRGEYLFRSKGCVTCHGPGARGGVANPNYIKDKVPALNVLADSVQLWEPEDVETIIHLLEEGRDLASLEGDPPVERYPIFLAQFQALRDRVCNGNEAGKKDPGGPEPPLQMPAWRAVLSDRDIDAILGYLLSQFPWDEDL